MNRRQTITDFPSVGIRCKRIELIHTCIPNHGPNDHPDSRSALIANEEPNMTSIRVESACGNDSGDDDGISEKDLVTCTHASIIGAMIATTTGPSLSPTVDSKTIVSMPCTVQKLQTQQQQQSQSQQLDDLIGWWMVQQDCSLGLMYILPVLKIILLLLCVKICFVKKFICVCMYCMYCMLGVSWARTSDRCSQLYAQTMEAIWIGMCAIRICCRR